jgi:hypothetical protein
MMEREEIYGHGSLRVGADGVVRTEAEELLEQLSLQARTPEEQLHDRVRAIYTASNGVYDLLSVRTNKLSIGQAAHVAKLVNDCAKKMRNLLATLETYDIY